MKKGERKEGTFHGDGTSYKERAAAAAAASVEAKAASAKMVRGTGAKPAELAQMHLRAAQLHSVAYRAQQSAGRTSMAQGGKPGVHQSAAEEHQTAVSSHQNTAQSFHEASGASGRVQRDRTPEEKASRAAGRALVRDPHTGIVMAKSVQASIATTNAENASSRARFKSSTQSEHKEAGEAHLAAASLHASIGQEKQADKHRAVAATHAASAGGAWDEDKHPRDEHGKFT